MELKLQKFKKAVKSKRVMELETSMDVACKEIGISKPTLSRIEKGTVPSIDVFIKIIVWLGHKANDYINDEV